MTSYPLFRVMIAVLIALSSVACPKGRGTEDPIAAALQRLSTATNPKVRLSALDTLRDSRDLRVNPALLKRLLEESDPTVLTALIRLVAERRLNDALPALLTIVRRVPGEPRV
ncbi:MAG: HEAT repeat domain-containing protein, partial [Myxococcales bacterium]|nr:HEAT repeat domain-containing protein [Myxococcales bacterium]